MTVPLFTRQLFPRRTRSSEVAPGPCVRLGDARLRIRRDLLEHIMVNLVHTFDVVLRRERLTRQRFDESLRRYSGEDYASPRNVRKVRGAARPPRDPIPGMASDRLLGKNTGSTGGGSMRSAPRADHRSRIE